MIAFETMNLPLILCGLFYGVLCIFSIVTGLIYMSGKRKLNITNRWIEEALKGLHLSDRITPNRFEEVSKHRPEVFVFEGVQNRIQISFAD